MSILNESSYSFLANFFAEDSHIDHYSICLMQSDAGLRRYYRISTKYPLTSSTPNTSLAGRLAHETQEQGFPLVPQNTPATYEACKDLMAEARPQHSLGESYTRNSLNKSYILMDCPPSYTPIQPFIQIANYINSIGLRAPKIYAYDESQGYILLEDFGKITGRDFLESLKHDQKDEAQLGLYKKPTEHFYKIAIDLIIKLQNNFDSGTQSTRNLDLNYFSDASLIKELEVFLQWYIQLIGKGGAQGYLDNHNISQEFITICSNLLAEIPDLPNTMVLRDYHVENIMMLNTKNLSVSAIGLLDFQDALIGSPVYDLVSLLEDARIDVSRELALKMIKYFAKEKDINADIVMRQYHILGIQRNLRILGVFARKSLRDKDNRYLSYIDRMINYLSYDLSLPHSDHSKKLKRWLAIYANMIL